MGKLNFDIDEAALLKAYRISSLEPTQWEDVDHEFSDSLAGALTGSPNEGVSHELADPLGLYHHGVDTSEMKLEAKAAVLITSKSFDPKAFLSTIHPNATHQDLTAGTARLKQTLDSRSEAIRVLVEDNFDHYVSVKASTESLYMDMKERFLAPESDYGSKEILEKLKLASAKADQVFQPILENAAKAQRVRATLGNRYEVALRDYNKGKYLMDSRPGRLISVAGGSSTESQQKRVLNKVWGAVEKVMGEMRNLLISQLQQPTRSVDEQRKTIEILLEMNIPDDPVWIYLDNQHKYILGQLGSSFEASVKSIDDGAHGSAEWKATLNLVKAASEVMLTLLPPFWKIAKDYLDGAFKKSSGVTVSRRSPNQCRTMAFDIVNLYISLPSEYFTLSDKAVVTNTASGIPPFVPTASSSITTSWFVSKILSEMEECVNDVTTAELSGEASSGLKSLLESARWRFVDAVCDNWLRDSQRFHHLETWEQDPKNPPFTLFLSQIQKFQTYVTTCTYKIAGGIDISNPKTPTKQLPIGREFSSKIQRTFLDSVYALLDGLELLSRAQYEPVLTKEAAPLVLTSITPATPQSLDRDTRMLLITSSFGLMSKAIIPTMINQLESALNVSISHDRKTLMEVVSVLDSTLFDDFIRLKSSKVREMIHTGVNGGTADWTESTRPTEVRGYMYEVLLFFVTVHQHVIVVAKPLLERTMVALVEALTEEALAAFRQVNEFGIGGMLRATLEIEFAHQTLLQYVSPKASEILTSIYSTISQAYSRQKKLSRQENLQRELDGVKRTLHESRRSTAIEFRCFKPTKETNAM
ncbi:exocyst complex component sec5 [Cantharellus anzutake]|uniref:exocyst complex component sec5 n=1 Tax=Cantharellus anzutake TaxID=1750568 RepID=UPI001904B970|nr:exocyst complex component sec5 [Cantharellus anzutake]KAF8329383.1 exocyst complex component sec5 [Cantharellus anzutake]